MLIHPDFLLSYPLAKKIKQYGFFSYAANEALHLSDFEKETILLIFKIIDEELRSRIDDFSHDVMISKIELLLNYCNRFYKRQFITRKTVNNRLLQKMEDILDDYFNNEKSLSKGIPTIQFLSENLNISPGYLGLTQPLRIFFSHYYFRQAWVVNFSRKPSSILYLNLISFFLGYHLFNKVIRSEDEKGQRMLLRFKTG